MRLTRLGHRSAIAVGFAAASFQTHGVAGQEAPHVSGRVEIVLASGTVAGDVCVSDIPVRGDTVSIVLNSSLAIERISGVIEVPLAIEAEPAGAAIRYWFVGASPRYPGSADEPVADICVQYAGRELVHDVAGGVYRAADSSDVIAFNGRAVRARGVSRWHPTPYEPSTGLAADAVRFDLEVECSECGVIYVNGGAPEAGPVARFRSIEPRELLLVAGDLPTSGTDGLLIIGEDVPEAKTAVLNRHMHVIMEFLEEFVGVPFGPPPVLVRLEAVRAQRRGQLWGFYSDPALVLIGMSINEIVDALEGVPDLPRRTLIGFLAHELSHRYFGWGVGPRSAQRDLFGEPFATYLELKAARHIFGAEEYERGKRRLVERARSGDQPADLASATAADLAHPRYRYVYAPALLFTLENEIGEGAMRRLLSALISAPVAERLNADYAFLRETALRTGISMESWTAWEESCVASSVRADECIERVAARLSP